jgi:hypothetical protein
MVQPVAHELHHAAAGLANRACDAQKFVGAGPQGGDCLAADAAVVDGARGGKAERAGLVSRIVPADKLLDEALASASTICEYSLPSVMAALSAVPPVPAPSQ